MSNYNIDWQSGGDEGIPGKGDIILPQKTIDTTSTSIALTGKGVPNYGEIQQENFIRLMENFASKFPPANPTIGQIWFNTEETILYLRVDPDLVADQYARYFPESPAAWVQIWPQRNNFASLQEYSAMALTINRIIGTPSTYGSSSTVEDNEYGWGQNDLVPEYDSLNQLKAQFLPPYYPEGHYPIQFDNAAWAILLSRLRKALRHVGIAENSASPVGFIDDGRPPGDGNALANDFNDFGGAGTLPNITAGWNGASFLTLQLYYAATLSAISSLNGQRFVKAGVSSESEVLITKSRPDPWNTSVYQDLTFRFVSQDAARAFFNSGGQLGFQSSISGGSTPLNASWTAFLTNLGEVRFDYKGVFKPSTSVYDIPPSQTSPVGFYDLTNSWQVVFEESRNFGSYYSGIYDGGFRVWARYEIDVDSTYVLFIRLVWLERDDIGSIGETTGEYVDGVLSSTTTGYKASELNVNSPEIGYPVTSSGDIVFV